MSTLLLLLLLLAVVVCCLYRDRDSGGAAGGVQEEHGLDGHVHGGHVGGLEHALGHLLPVGLGVEGASVMRVR